MKEKILNEIIKIQKEFWGSFDIPLIRDVILDDRTLTIIGYDRTDKSLIIGKGYLVGKLKKNLKDLNVNKIRILSYNDLLLKKLRIKQTIRAIDEKKYLFNSEIRSFLEEFKNVLQQYLRTNEIIPLKNEYRAVVALSGGVDSSCSTILAKKLGLNVTAVTVDPGEFILTKFMRDNVQRVIKYTGVKHLFLKENLREVYEEALKGKYHPCTKCSKQIKNKILEYCKKNRVHIVIFGDNISTGSQAIAYLSKDLVRLNLPACFCLTKREIKEIVKPLNLNRYPYGCVMHLECLKRNPQFLYYTIQRITREVRAGVQEPSDAARTIIDLFKVIYKFNIRKK